MPENLKGTLMISMRSGVLCGLVLALCSFAAVAHAQETGADDERARVHFQSGRSYFEEGSYEQALQEFSRAYELSPRAVLLVNIANVQERLAQWDAAAASLQRFVDTLPATDPQVATLQRRIVHLRERQAQQASQTPPDGTTATTSTSATTTTTTGTGATAGASTTTGTATTRPDAPVSEATTGLLVPSLIAFGVSAVGLISFGVFGGLAMSEESSVASGCGATVSCTPDQVQAMDDLALVADISLAIGLAAAATGAILILVSPPRSASTESLSARLVPYGGPLGGGVAVVGSF